MVRAMARGEQRELKVLSDAAAYPTLQSNCYNFMREAELAATATRLGRKPISRMIEVSEIPEAGGLVVYLTRIHESGRARLRELQEKLAIEQRKLNNRVS
jgi:hypothetical protein